MARRSSFLRELFTFHPGWVTLSSALALAVLGIFTIATVEPGFAAVQARWLLISLAAMALCLIPHPRLIGQASFALLGLTLVLLVLVIAPGVPRGLVPVRNGATSWINCYFMMFQPSELAKIVCVLALAWYLRHRENHRGLLGLLLPFGIMFLPVGLILKQPDLGTAILFPPALFAMLVAAGARLRHLGALVLLGVLAVSLNVAIIYLAPDSLQILKPHQRLRIVAMISQAQGDHRYIQDIGYQQYKATTLLGAGGLEGLGAQRSGKMIRLNRLPEDHNDMIFVVLVNRWGLIGGLVTLGLYFLLILSFVLVCRKSKDPFARLATVGFGGLIFTQMAINIGMTVGLVPVTGITLPFVSYGGSSLLTTFATVGLVINFAYRRPALINRPTFEFDRQEQTQESRA